MWKRMLIPALAAALQAAPVHAGEFRAGLGAFVFSGFDVQLGYRPDHSHWLYGYRYLRIEGEGHDPFTNRTLTNSTETLNGPVVTYLFGPEEPSSWYAAAAVYRWSLEERASATGEVGSDSRTAAFVGGGYTGKLGQSLYYNAGLLVSFGSQLHARTSVSSSDTKGIDVLLQAGIAF